MSETNAYDSLKRTVKRGIWYRFENPITPGLPDALVIVSALTRPVARYTWLEAKELKWRARRRVFEVDNLRTEQITEMLRLQKSGAHVYLLLHYPLMRWIIEPDIMNMTRLQDGVDVEWLNENDVPWQDALLPREEDPWSG